MKLEPSFVKPIYKYNNETKEHPIERLEFKEVAENDFERMGLALKQLNKNLINVLKGTNKN